MFIEAICLRWSVIQTSLLNTSLIDDFVDVNTVTAYEPMTETPLHLSTNKRMKLIIIGLHTSPRVNENRSSLKPSFLYLEIRLKVDFKCYYAITFILSRQYEKIIYYTYLPCILID